MINIFLYAFTKYGPELVIVSAGFDAAKGDPLVRGIIFNYYRTSIFLLFFIIITFK